MTATPTIEARLAEVLPCRCAKITRPDNWEGEWKPVCDFCSWIIPAVLTLIRTLLREERERCAEKVLHGFNAGWSAEEIDAAIRNLEDRP